MEPKDQLSLDQFHEWYNNEHGPNRLRLEGIFTNGLRYRANDSQKPRYMAIYDLSSISHLAAPTYTSLRYKTSSYEVETIGQVDVKRYFYDLVWEKRGPQFLPLEHLTDDQAEGTEVITNQLVFEGDKELAEYIKWYKEEHVVMLSKVPGWLRTRHFTSSSTDPNGQKTYLVYNEFAKQNGLGGPEHKESISTNWATNIATNCIKEKTRRTYSLFYVFGQGPRDLESLASLRATRKFSADGSNLIKLPGFDQEAVINSFVTAPDGLRIPYRLEGNADPKAPVIAFSNSLLTSLSMCGIPLFPY